MWYSFANSNITVNKGNDLIVISSEIGNIAGRIGSPLARSPITQKGAAREHAARHPKWGRGRIRQALVLQYGEAATKSERTIGSWLREFRKVGTVGSDTGDPPIWRGINSQDAAQTRASYLLGLDLLAGIIWPDRLASGGRHALYEIEARWACRLEDDLIRLPEFAQLFLIEEYAKREWAARDDNTTDFYTGDLDALIVVKPWTDGRRHDTYRRILKIGGAPVPYIESLAIPPGNAPGDLNSGLVVLAIRVFAEMGVAFHGVYQTESGKPAEAFVYPDLEDDIATSDVVNKDWLELLADYWEVKIETEAGNA